MDYLAYFGWKLFCLLSLATYFVLGYIDYIPMYLIKSNKLSLSEFRRDYPIFLTNQSLQILKVHMSELRQVSFVLSAVSINIFD